MGGSRRGRRGIVLNGHHNQVGRLCCAGTRGLGAEFGGIKWERKGKGKGNEGDGTG